MSRSKKKRRRENTEDINEEGLSAKRIRAECLKLDLKGNKVLATIKGKIENGESLKGLKRVNVRPRLDTKQVIYIVYNTRDTMRYIGHTSKDAIYRFMEHVRQAKQMIKLDLVEYNIKMKQKLLYSNMIKIGLEGWYVYPIEQVQADNLNFKEVACGREQFWIQYFGTLTPHGLNMILPASENNKVDTILESKADNEEAGDIKTTQPLVVYKLRRYDSRNYKKKLQRLNTQIEENKLDCRQLEKYKLKNIEIMLNIIDNTNPALLNISPDNAQILRGFFKNILNKPLLQSSQKQEQICIQLSIRQIQNIRLREYFTCIKWIKHLPLKVRGRIPRISYKYVRTLGRIAFNYMNLRQLTSTEAEAILNTNCKCEEKSLIQYMDSNFGHIITTDCNICPEPHLRNFLLKGANFRPTSATSNAETVSEDIKREFNSLISKWCNLYTLHSSELQLWQNLCMEDVKTQLQALIKEPEADITWLKSDQTALFGLQKDYIITYVDKAANIFAFICKKHYIKILIQEYKLPTYKVSQLPLQDILNLHHTYTRKLGITFNKEAYNKVAYAYTSHKATKVTADVRYIAGSYMCSLQPLSVHINMILNKLKPKIYQIWNTKLKNNNTTALRIWMLKHSAEVPYRIKLFNRTYNYPAQRPILLESYDVKTLYQHPAQGLIY